MSKLNIVPSRYREYRELNDKLSSVSLQGTIKLYSLPSYRSLYNTGVPSNREINRFKKRYPPSGVKIVISIPNLTNGCDEYLRSWKCKNLCKLQSECENEVSVNYENCPEYQEIKELEYLYRTQLGEQINLLFVNEDLNMEKEIKCDNCSNSYSTTLYQWSKGKLSNKDYIDKRIVINTQPLDTYLLRVNIISIVNDSLLSVLYDLLTNLIDYQLESEDYQLESKEYEQED